MVQVYLKLLTLFQFGLWISRFILEYQFSLYSLIKPHNLSIKYRISTWKAHIFITQLAGHKTLFKNHEKPVNRVSYITLNKTIND